MTLTPTTEAPGPTDRTEKVGTYGHLTDPVKIALEVNAHGIAIELGAPCSRVHVLSHGALSTRTASALGRFDERLGTLVSGHPGITSSTWSRWDA